MKIFTTRFLKYCMNAKIMSFLTTFLFLNAHVLANDLSPQNCQPASVGFYYTFSPITVSFDVCFDYDYQVYPGECSVNVIIRDQVGTAVFTKTIPNVVGNGPGYCLNIIAGEFITSSAGSYTLTVVVNYFYDINPGNNTCAQLFEVRLPVPPQITNISPQNGAANIPPSPPPTLSWENGSTPITQQGIEVKQGSEFIVSQNLPSDAESFTFPNALSQSTQFQVFLSRRTSK